MRNHQVVNNEQWLNLRKKLLTKEKEFTVLRDQLSQQRREMPWVKIDKDYRFDSTQGTESLADLFNGKSQLIVYHFMFHQDWQIGCKSCSFWADNFNNIVTHLNHRDVNLVAVSSAPLKRLIAFRKRMGWNFHWVSSSSSEFNADYNVTFTADDVKSGTTYYNYQVSPFPIEEAPGISVFYKNEFDELFHTYSCYSRGLDMLNGAYHYLDLVPKGRDEKGLASTMDWLRLHDSY